MKSALFVTMVLLAGCASQKTSAIPPGPNYSRTPCSENCGPDSICNASCMPGSAPTVVYSSH